MQLNTRLLPKPSKLRHILLSCLLMVSSLAFAASSPVDMLQGATSQMLSALQQTQNRNEQSLYNLVKRILLPHVNVDLMSQLVVGKYWVSATPEQRAEFKTQFTHFVTRTYSTALNSYSNQTVRYFPLRGDVTGNRVQVNSAIEQKNGSSVSVTYRLIQTGGEWKVYDFSVEGVSIIENYRSQFADVLRTSGLDGLNARLRAQNQG